MTPRLPIVLTSDDLPNAELAAARLDGEVYAVGSGFAPIDEIEEPAHRAASLRTGIHDRLIAEQRSAAWVWGALQQPPTHHEFCVGMGARVGHSSVRWLTVREVVIAPTEVVFVNHMAVTTPLRTTLDLLRFSPEFGSVESGVVNYLMRFGKFDSERCRAELDRRRNLPNKRRAAARLADCVG